MIEPAPLKRLASSLALAAAFIGAGMATGTPVRDAVAQTAVDEPTAACPAVGTWIEPDTGEAMTTDRLLASLSGVRVILLGESHANAEHHRWQLHSLAGLNAHRSELVIGFEMFPRSVQPALDAWSSGKTSQEEFLSDARWHHVWGYDAELYLPLFDFARQNRLPMVALNVEREMVARVGKEGWGALEADEREGLSNPAPASEDYRRTLAEVYATKQKRGLKEPSGDEERAAGDISQILSDPKFERFVEAQLTWDRAMAEALFEASRANPNALVVGVMGRGHLEHGHGVPHQLKDLGEESIAVLLPVEVDEACDTFDRGLADALFVLASETQASEEPVKPRLGVMIEETHAGVRVLDVIDGSVAEATGLLPGDIIVSAASIPVSEIAALIEIIQRQAPGTLLPLEIQRDGKSLNLVAEFPPDFE
jgi:uncharacterized iron-regulated protein